MAKKPLTNQQASALIRALTARTQGRGVTRGLQQERPGGASRPRPVAKPGTGLSASERARVSVEMPVERTKVPPRGAGNTAIKTPLGGKVKPGLTNLQARVNSDTSSAKVSAAQRNAAVSALNNSKADVNRKAAAERTLTQVDRQTAERAARAAKDKKAIQEANEARISAAAQRGASIRTGGKVQNPRAEPMTQKVVDEQVRVGETVKRGPAGGIKEGARKGNAAAVAAARNRIEKNARGNKSSIVNTGTGAVLKTPSFQPRIGGHTN